MFVGVTRRRRLRGDLACFAMSYFLLVDLLLPLIWWIHVLLSPLAHRPAVADFDLVDDVIFARIPILILDRLGSDADMGRFDLNFLSSFTHDDYYPNIHIRRSNRTPLFSLYSNICHSADYIDYHYLFLNPILAYIPFLYSPDFHYTVHTSYV